MVNQGEGCPPLTVYTRDMNRRAQSYTRYRQAEWILLSVAVLFMVAFLVAAAYVAWLFMHSWAGMPVRYILLLATSLAVSVAASLSLARLELKRQRASF